MAEQPPPRKIGSLRDRIAAFENKGPPVSAPAPAPRPKPGQVKWQPRDRSPPPPPSNTDAGEGADYHAMNPNDAAESIGKMSLKERMAALQGQGAFGAPALPSPPIQKSDKPKWKPPPQPMVTSASEAEDDGGASGVESVKSPLKSPMSGLSELEGEEGGLQRRASADRGLRGQEGDEVGELEGDEEEERKRRAAIAARMARLGGARLGMAPPVYAPKPRPEAKPSQPSGDEEADKSPETVPEDAKGASQTSLVSDTSAKSPSMPIPSQPRRSGPPRRRAPKSPGASQTDLTSDVQSPPAEGEGELGASAVNTLERSEPKAEPEPAEEVEETEEEAAARRKRIAERIAKSGGLNFLSAPRPSEEEEEESGVGLAAEPEAGTAPVAEAEEEHFDSADRVKESPAHEQDDSEIDGSQGHEHEHVAEAETNADQTHGYRAEGHSEDSDSGLAEATVTEHPEEEEEALPPLPSKRSPVAEKKSLDNDSPHPVDLADEFAPGDVGHEEDKDTPHSHAIAHGPSAGTTTKGKITEDDDDDDGQESEDWEK